MCDICTSYLPIHTGCSIIHSRSATFLCTHCSCNTFEYKVSPEIKTFPMKIYLFYKHSIDMAGNPDGQVWGQCSEPGPLLDNFHSAQKFPYFEFQTII